MRVLKRIEVAAEERQTDADTCKRTTTTTGMVGSRYYRTMEIVATGGDVAEMPSLDRMTKR